MTQAREFHVRPSKDVITAGAAQLAEEFPELTWQRVVQALARADDELRTGYAVLHLEPDPRQLAGEVVGLARQELERATDRLDRKGQPISSPNGPR